MRSRMTDLAIIRAMTKQSEGAPVNDRIPNPEEREEWDFQASLELQQRIEEDYERDQAEAEAWSLEDCE